MTMEMPHWSVDSLSMDEGGTFDLGPLEMSGEKREVHPSSICSDLVVSHLFNHRRRRSDRD